MTKFLSLLPIILVWLWVPLESRAAEMDLEGEVQVRGFYTQNLSDAHSGNSKECPGPDGELGTGDDTCDDQEAFNDIRFRLRIKAAHGIAAGVAVVDLFSQEGENVATLSPESSTTVETGFWRMGSEGPGAGLTTIVLREGYLQFTLPRASMVIGRQGIHLGHGLILDDTVDALVVLIPAGQVGLTFGNVKLVEADSDIGGDLDTDIYFSNVSWTPSPSAVTNFFIVYLRDRGPDLAIKGFCDLKNNLLRIIDDRIGKDAERQNRHGGHGQRDGRRPGS